MKDDHEPARPGAPNSIDVLHTHQHLEDALRGLQLVLELGRSTIEKNTGAPSTIPDILADWRVIQGLLHHAGATLDAAFNQQRVQIRHILQAVSSAEDGG